MQESKYIFLFSKLFNAENRSATKSVGKVFLMIKIGPGFMGSLVYSLIKLCGIKRKIDDQNIDMIFYYVNLIIFIWASRSRLKMMQHILLILH
jgi:hypothetical protein